MQVKLTDVYALCNLEGIRSIAKKLGKDLPDTAEKVLEDVKDTLYFDVHRYGVWDDGPWDEDMTDEEAEDISNRMMDWSEDCDKWYSEQMGAPEDMTLAEKAMAIYIYHIC